MQEETSNNEESMGTFVATATPTPMHLVKQVRFVEQPPTRCTALSPLDLLPNGEEFRTLWYRHEEIKVFRDEAREICLKMRTLLDAEQAAVRATTAVVAKESSSSVVPLRTPLLARDDATRGLERRACPERHRRTYLGTGLILKGAASYRHDPDKLAALAQKCTGWATTLAVTEGARDAQRAAAVDEAEFTSPTTTGTRSNSPKAIAVAIRIIPSSSLRTNPLSSSLSESTSSSGAKRLRSRQPHR
jgi:hypothetical protein